MMKTITDQHEHEKPLGTQGVTAGDTAFANPAPSTASHAAPVVLPRCEYCAHRMHGPAGCIVRAGIKTPAESHRYVIDGLDAEVTALRASHAELYEALKDRVFAEHDDATHWPKGSERDGHKGEFESCQHQDCRLIAKAEGR